MLKIFVRAVLVGTLAGAWLPVMFAFLAAMLVLSDSTDWTSKLTLIASLVGWPIIITLCFVLLSSLLIGVPATLLFRRTKADVPITYAALGALTGPLMVMAAMWIQRTGYGVWPLALSIFSGGMTGWTWGTQRMIWFAEHTKA
ncbi:hypothetical protein ACFFF7_12685 [Novosphingobium aquiterrae]|uniref:Uncharacterized protein n=1 Tax=Novosphingobium aquiterrae TaxID=624388 RepID=A0ABV6PKA8_9SPHN